VLTGMMHRRTPRRSDSLIPVCGWTCLDRAPPLGAASREHKSEVKLERRRQADALGSVRLFISCKKVISKKSFHRVVHTFQLRSALRLSRRRTNGNYEYLPTKAVARLAP